MNTTQRTLGLGLGLFAAGVAVGFAASRARRVDDPPNVVPNVDLERYTGVWYEIASFPKRFQRGCHGTTAEYSIRDDGTIGVTNTCRKGSLDGKLSRAEGKAWVVDPYTNARLKVQFFWPFRGDYWIFELGLDYQYAVVGAPDRNSLWILSRTPVMDREVLLRLLDRLEKNGWDTSRLQMTPQPNVLD